MSTPPDQGVELGFLKTKKIILSTPGDDVSSVADTHQGSAAEGDSADKFEPNGDAEDDGREDEFLLGDEVLHQ